MAEIDLADVTTVRIHPAIGIARLGDSDEYVLGPEVPGAPPETSGTTPETKFKDAQKRVKRQAARFRCFGYDASGGYVELTGKAEVTITWEVTLANSKAAAPNFDAPGRRNEGQAEKDLIIAPGSRSIVGRKTSQPPAPVAFDNGRVKFTLNKEAVEIKDIYLGELRTDENGCLLVLGGRGRSRSHPKAELNDFANNDNWCDDVSDGPVKAKVAITVGGTEHTFTAEPAWVVAAPAKFAPELDSPTTLWDQLMYAFGIKEPDRPAYVADIYPVLQSARTILAVHENADGHHKWQHPVIDDGSRKAIFKWIRNPASENGGVPTGTMPDLTGLTSEYPSLTPRQYAIMKKWKEGSFDNDWKSEWGHDTPPFASFPITPDGLDRAALHGCVGAAFYPGIESGNYLIERDDNKKLTHWKEPYQRFRFADHVEPGDVTAKMAVPWQADFAACGDNWWPVPRPNQAVPKGTASYKEWDRNLGGARGMVANWQKLGVVVRDTTGSYVEVARSLPEPTRLELTRLDFPVTAALSGPEPMWPEVGELAAYLADAPVLAFGQATTQSGQTQSWPLWLTEIDGELTVEIRSTDLDRLEVRLSTPLGPRLAPGDFGLITSGPDGGRLRLRVELPYHVMAGRYVRHGLWRVHVRAEQEVTYQLAATAQSLITFPSMTTAVLDGSVTARVDFTGAPISRGDAVVWPMSSRGELQEVALRTEAAPQADRVAGQVAVQQAQYLRVQVTGTSPKGNPFVRERLMRTDELP